MNLPPNYEPDVNRFKLAGPPAYFRRALWAFDSSLVIVPSREGFMYRLCLRRKLTLPDHIVNDALFNHSDTRMLATYGLVPVTTILATVNWANPTLIEQLRQRAPHMNGGADAVVQRIEREEAEDRAKIRRRNDEMTTDMAKDAWGMYHKKIGLRTHAFPVRTPNRPTAPKAAPSIRTSNKAVPNGADSPLVSIFIR